MPSTKGQGTSSALISREMLTADAKCDETAQFCRQCLRFGLECSGPVQGMTVIDMTKKASGTLPFKVDPRRKISNDIATGTEKLRIPSESGLAGDTVPLENASGTQ